MSNARADFLWIVNVGSFSDAMFSATAAFLVDNGGRFRSAETAAQEASDRRFRMNTESDISSFSASGRSIS